LVGDEAGDWAIVEVVLNNNAATIITENKFNLKRPIFFCNFSDFFQNSERELRKKSVCFCWNWKSKVCVWVRNEVRVYIYRNCKRVKCEKVVYGLAVDVERIHLIWLITTITTMN
jgi:hypothetical protein